MDIDQPKALAERLRSFLDSKGHSLSSTATYLNSWLQSQVFELGPRSPPSRIGQPPPL